MFTYKGLDKKKFDQCHVSLCIALQQGSFSDMAKAFLPIGISLDVQNVRKIWESFPIAIRGNGGFSLAAYKSILADISCLAFSVTRRGKLSVRDKHDRKDLKQFFNIIQNS